MKVKVKAYVAVGSSGCSIEDTYELNYTKEEWGNLTEEEKEHALQYVLDGHIGNNMDCGAWVED